MGKAVEGAVIIEELEEREEEEEFTNEEEFVNTMKRVERCIEEICGSSEGCPKYVDEPVEEFCKKCEEICDEENTELCKRICAEMVTQRLGELDYEEEEG